MSLDEQLLDPDIHHIGIGDGSCPSPTTDVESSQRSNDECIGAYAQADGKHQELWGIPRDSPPGEPTVYSLLR